MKIAYISGPYRGPTIFHRAWNIYKARQVAKKYWQLGYATFCPHSNTAFFDGLVHDDSFLRGDIRFLDHADLIVMQGKWPESNGSLMELHYAVCEVALKTGGPTNVIFETEALLGQILVRRMLQLAWGDTHHPYSCILPTPSEEADAIKSVRKGGILRRLRDTILQPKSPSMDREGG